MSRVSFATDSESAYYRAYAVTWWKGEWEFRREFPSRVEAATFRERIKAAGRDVAASISAVVR